MTRITPTRDLLTPICISKSEYFRAQLREKDKVIETLLKQVRGPASSSPPRARAHPTDKQLHNPYSATPLAVAGYRDATASRDRSNSEVLAWLQRLQESAAQASASRPPVSRSPGQNVGSPSSDTNTLESETVQTLPDSAVPIGLFANLALENKKKPENVPLPPSPDEDDEDTVVGFKICISL
jgi:hypothetical protein